MEVFVVGPSSCGKTTLCNALAKYCNVPPPRHIKEVARTVMREQGFSRRTVGMFEMQFAIMRAQLKEEKRAREEKSTVPLSNCILLLSDRSAIDPIVYAEICGTETRKMKERLLQSQELQDVIPNYQRSLFVLLPSIEEWLEDDGVRSLDNSDKYNNAMKLLLNELNIAFREVRREDRDIDLRVGLVSKWVREEIEAGKG